MADEKQNDDSKVPQTVVGAILCIAGIVGFVATIMRAGVNGPNGGDPWILLPYVVIVLLAASWFLLKHHVAP